jgi:hypothetical protein
MPPERQASFTSVEWEFKKMAEAAKVWEAIDALAECIEDLIEVSEIDRKLTRQIQRRLSKIRRLVPDDLDC